MSIQRACFAWLAVVLQAATAAVAGALAVAAGMCFDQHRHLIVLVSSMLIAC